MLMVLLRAMADERDEELAVGIDVGIEEPFTKVLDEVGSNAELVNRELDIGCDHVDVPRLNNVGELIVF